MGAGASFHRRQTRDGWPGQSASARRAGLQAHYLFAIAENDDAKEPEAKTVLREAFAAAGLPAEIEVYAGTLHGWCSLDSTVYHEEQRSGAWGRLLVLFEAALA